MPIRKGGPFGESARLELEWKNFATRMMVDMDLMLEPEIRVIQDDMLSFMRDQVILAMRVKVLSDDLPPEKVEATQVVGFHEPASTWQMWKRNNRGRWYTWKWLDAWLRKWPVRTVEIKKSASVTLDLSRFRSYPEAQYRASDFRLGRARLHHTLGSPIWDIEHLTGYDYGKPGEGE